MPAVVYLKRRNANGLAETGGVSGSRSAVEREIANRSTPGAGESLIVLPLDTLQVSRTIPAPFGRHSDAARIGVL